jgi:hypothetical protein
MVLKLPVGAEAAFQVLDTDAFGNSFSIHLYGARRRGWFLASLRFSGDERDSGPQRLAKGQWRSFLNLVKQSRFWDLPEEWPDPWPNDLTEDGEWLTISGREGERYHRVHRFVWREPGLDQVLLFCRRVCGFFPAPPVSSPEATPAAEGSP